MQGIPDKRLVGLLRGESEGGGVVTLRWRGLSVRWLGLQRRPGMGDRVLAWQLRKESVQCDTACPRILLTFPSSVRHGCHGSIRTLLRIAGVEGP